MSRKELEKEAKKRARRAFFLALLAFAFMGVGSAWSSFRTVCSTSNPLYFIQCPSEGTQFSFGLLGGLVLMILLGIPFGYMAYNDIKWSLYGYKTPAKGIITRVLLYVTIAVEVIPVTFYIDTSSIPSWIGFTLLALIYIWFFFSLANYSALRKKYAEDKKKKKLPKMTLPAIMEKERKEAEEIARINKADKKTRKKSSKDDYDDGL